MNLKTRALPEGRTLRIELAEPVLVHWSADDFVRALHRGIAPGGRYLYPAFPYTSFMAMSRDDALAIKAYLFSLPPQHGKPPVERH